MRRFQDSFESNSINAWSASVTNTGWTIGASTANPRKGTHHLRAEWNGVDKTAGAYVQRRIGFSTAPKWTNLNGGDSDLGLLPSNGTSFDLSFEYSTTANAALNVLAILTILNGATEKFRLTVVGGDRRVDMRVPGQYTGTGNTEIETVVSTLSVSTKYRFRIRGRKAPSSGAAGPGYISVWIYTTDTYTLLGHASMTFNGGEMDRLRLGAVPVSTALQSGAQVHDFYDTALNDHQDIYSNGLHTGDPGGNATQTIDRPTGDTLTINWNTTGGDHFGELADANDATNIFTILGASTPTDRHTLDSWGARSNIVKSIAMLIRQGSPNGTGLFHNAGFYDGTSEIAATMFSGANIYEGFILEQKDGGGALDNSYWDSLDTQFRKAIDFIGINDKKVMDVWVEASDDDGLALAGPDLDQQQAQGSVA